MKNIFKQSEGSDTSSTPNTFKRAVIRLTVYYSVGVFIILAIFSFLVYGMFSESIDDDIREDESGIEREEEFHEEVKENLFNILLLSDAFLLFIAVFISYFFSRKTLEPLEMAYRKQKQFVADAAHELRTPLAVMKAGGEVLAQKERNLSEYKHFLAESSEEVERLIKLSNDLLFLANAEDTRKDDLEEVSLSDVVKRQCESIVPYANSKKNEVHSQVVEDVRVLGNKDDITRLVLNLLKNAVDYNKAEGIVTVTLSKKGTKALLVVKDTGIGIAHENLPFIFDRFYKADASRTQTVSSGSGLGLAIVRDIVTRHGGTIDVISSAKGGTQFTISLPSMP